MVALPMFAGSEVGVVFLHREDEADVPSALMLWIMFLVERASAAIQQARSYTEERRRRFQLMGQQRTARALFEAVGKSSKLEEFITGSLLNLSSADLTLLYRVHPSYCEATPWSRAGFRMGGVSLDSEIAQLIEQVARSGSARLFRTTDWDECDSLPEGDEMKAALLRARRFMLAERVSFLGVLPIRSTVELTTVLVFAYRRTSEPARSEQRNLELLASTVSVALAMGGTRAAKQDLLAAARICRTLELYPQPAQLRSH
jgi:GAF domain-containing protein